MFFKAEMNIMKLRGQKEKMKCKNKICAHITDQQKQRLNLMEFTEYL